ncbi:MAG: GDSL family lipase, partial [Rikenellaceae bacterium]|nr:GDSL family lipase [Rikenellaceae bacterium]
MKRLFTLIMALGCFCSVEAQTDYHIQKATLYDLLPISKKDIVFLGNSLTDGCEWDELFGMKNIKNRGINADNTVQMQKRIDHIIKGQPKKLFLLTGVNDLADKRSPEETAANIAKMLDRFINESTMVDMTSGLLSTYSYSYASTHNASGKVAIPVKPYMVIYS